MRHRLAAFAVLAVFAAATAAASVAQVAPGPSAQSTPPPPPLPNTQRTQGPVLTPTQPNTPPPSLPPSIASPIPSPTASAAPKRGKGRGSSPAPDASPSETPAPPQFSDLNGVWEIQAQPLSGARTTYSHLRIVQKDQQVTGAWMRSGHADLPFTGTFDGRLFSFTFKDGNATTTMAGYVETFSDMVGMIKSGDPKDLGTPFTAQHRKKEKAI